VRQELLIGAFFGSSDKMWTGNAPCVERNDDRGKEATHERKPGNNTGRQSARFTISPLLAKSVLQRRFVLGGKMSGRERKHRHAHRDIRDDRDPVREKANAEEGYATTARVARHSPQGGLAI